LRPPFKLNLLFKKNPHPSQKYRKRSERKRGYRLRKDKLFSGSGRPKAEGEIISSVMLIHVLATAGFV
jgi:hypothetical protein